MSPSPPPNGSAAAASMTSNTTASEPAAKRARVDGQSEQTLSSAKNQTGLPPLTASLLESGKWSDLVIKCQGREWKCHRTVVCLQSAPLSAMISGEFIEAITGVIDLSENEPDIVNCMIQFMYTNEYSDSITTNSDIASTETSTASIDSVEAKDSLVNARANKPFLTNTKVYVLAEMFDLPALKAVAVKKFKTALTRKATSEGYTDSLILIHAETPDTDRALKDVALGYAVSHAAALLEKEDFQAFCKDPCANEFLMQMLKQMADNALSKTC
ncbi:uncharacterized protein LY89DRAFT_733580 [Mollisia scopiformis]|uniref:BTB domain-containing protein n=1 Tax=Mollisia scopiformis TaxID=149040 RepID=A0A194XC65_MOLSC|nr:uncharacterized protein LY89DRAFT_733580 [Mollisia scopiformis]KUJ17754.1 hypothetical protein LY89DRAFT_733580 [Mollisia scopiformis]